MLKFLLPVISGHLPNQTGTFWKILKLKKLKLGTDSLTMLMLLAEISGHLLSQTEM